jgi:hypothetical protein
MMQCTPGRAALPSTRVTVGVETLVLPVCSADERGEQSSDRQTVCRSPGRLAPLRLGRRGAGSVPRRAVSKPRVFKYMDELSLVSSASMLSSDLAFLCVSLIRDDSEVFYE